MAAAAVLFAFYGLFGDTVGGDANRYAHRGQVFLRAWFSDEPVVVRYDAWTIFYLIPNLVVGGGELLFGKAISPITLFFNVGAFAVMVAMLFSLWADSAQENIELRFLALGFFLILGLPGEVAKYNYSLLSSDILALSVLGGFFCFLARAILWRRTSDWVLAWLLAVVSIFMRPSGVMAPIIAAVAALMTATDVGTRRALLRNLILIGAPAVLAFSVWPFVIYLDSTGSAITKGLGPRLIFDYARDGMVVSMRFDTYVHDPKSYGDFVAIAVLRFAYYLVPLRKGYSLAHVFLNVTYLTVLVWALTTAVRSFRPVSRETASLVFMLFLTTYYFALFHVMTFVEDWRYQLPMWPSLWILAGYGVMMRLGYRLRPTPSVSARSG